jgi:predicted amidohydrolase
MKINLLQLDLDWADPEKNRNKAEEMMKTIEKADVYILPEMFSTGFATAPEGIAESWINNSCSSHQWMQSIAKDLDAAIVGSIAVREEDGRYYNRLCFVRPDGQTTFYDKHHLFTFGGEHLRYTAGDMRVVAEFRGFKFLLQICYDLRFPVFARNKADEAYDAVIYVASWPTPRVDAWLSLLKARAIENQCYVCAVNRVGKDPSCEYSGGTQLIDPYGRLVAACPMSEVASVCGKLDKDALYAFREKFPVLNDADAF